MQPTPTSREPVVRTPVTIIGQTLGRHYHRIVGHEAIMYSGGSPILNRLIRLSDEANEVCPGRQRYLPASKVQVAP